MQAEISELLGDLGYRHLDLRDPQTGQPVKTLQQSGAYRMLFAASDAPDTRISVRLDEGTGLGSLSLYQEGRSGLGKEGEARFGKLVQRLELEFGADNLTLG